MDKKLYIQPSSRIIVAQLKAVIMDDSPSFEIDGETAKIGRVVVLPEYRKQGLGRKVICEAENWIRELGFNKIVIDSRDVAVGFYKKLGYNEADGTVFHGDTFDCVKMTKNL